MTIKRIRKEIMKRKLNSNPIFFEFMVPFIVYQIDLKLTDKY